MGIFDSLRVFHGITFWVDSKCYGVVECVHQIIPAYTDIFYQNLIALSEMDILNGE